MLNVIGKYSDDDAAGSLCFRQESKQIEKIRRSVFFMFAPEKNDIASLHIVSALFAKENLASRNMVHNFSRFRVPFVLFFSFLVPFVCSLCSPPSSAPSVSSSSPFVLFVVLLKARK